MDDAKGENNLLAYQPQVIQAVINHITHCPTGSSSLAEVQALLAALQQPEVVRKVEDAKPLELVDKA